MLWLIMQLFHIWRNVEQCNHSRPKTDWWNGFPSEALLTQIPSWSTCAIILSGRYIFTAVIFEQYLDKCVLCLPVGVAQKRSRKKKQQKKTPQPTVLGVQITPTSLLKSIHYLSMWCKYLTQRTGTQGCQEGYPRVVRETALPFQK